MLRITALNISSNCSIILKATNRSFVLVQDLIVLGHGDAEDDGSDVLEAVDPLLTLTSLPANIKQSEQKQLLICFDKKKHFLNLVGFGKSLLHKGTLHEQNKKKLLNSDYPCAKLFILLLFNGLKKTTCIFSQRKAVCHQMIFLL